MSRPRPWLGAALDEIVLFALLLVLAARVGEATGWDQATGYLALRTRYWPFYVLDVESPLWTARLLFPVAAFAVACVPLGAWLRGEGSARAGLLSVAVGAWLFHLALAVAHLGLQHAFTDTFTRQGLEYWQDAPLVGHGFLARYPAIAGLSVHSSTHPPGLALLLAGVRAIGLRDPAEAELLCTTFAALTAFPLYGAARRLGGEAPARMAVALFLFACSVNAFAVLAMDTATMLLATVALYGFVRVLDGELVGGALLGVGLFAASLCNFVALMLTLTFVVLLLARWRGERRVVHALALAVALFFGGYALLRLGFRYHPIDAFRKCYATFKNPQLSMDVLRSRKGSMLGSPLEFLGALGLPLGAIAARAIGGALWRLRRRQEVGVALVVVAGAVPWLVGAARGRPRGEVEHSYLLFVPMVVIATSIAAHDWYGRDDRWLRFLALPALALQSILVEIYLSTYW
jgi:hypothetical protein